MTYPLQGEIYLICALMTALVLFARGKGAILSTLDLMLSRMALCFALSFVASAARCFCCAAGVNAGLYLYSAEFLLLGAGAYFWCGYAETALGRRIFEGKKHIAIVFLAPALIALIINLFTPVLFAMSAEGKITLKPLGHAYFAYLFACTLYVLTSLISRLVGDGDPSQKTALCLTALLPLCFPLKALLCAVEDGGKLLLVCVCIAFLTLGIYLTEMRRRISMDALTQVNNRHNLMGFLNYKLKNAEGEMCLMMIDLDDFKHINDTYGHPEGDRALCLAASALKRACGPFPKRPYIARYGGDEFIVVVEGSLEDAKRLQDTINEHLNSELIGGRDKISLSVGIAPYEEGIGAEEWIRRADKQLYAIKSRRNARA